MGNPRSLRSDCQEARRLMLERAGTLHGTAIPFMPYEPIEVPTWVEDGAR